MERVDLMSQVRAGEYVVDPYAVAEAMLGRRSVREALLSSEVLETGELDELAARADEPHSRPRLDAS